jgi:hypothetical protein
LVTSIAGPLGVERQGAKRVNPGPDEELHAGDQALLLGTTVQITAAKVCFMPAQKDSTTSRSCQAFSDLHFPDVGVGLPAGL